MSTETGSTSGTDIYTGACLCGQLSYQFSGAPFDLCYCHCSICRKLTGTDGAAYGSVPREAFAWLSTAAPAVYQPTPQSRRYFCANCGSYLLTEHTAEPENVFISLGGLDTELAAAPAYRQFTAGLPAWAAIHDPRPRHPGWPPLHP